MKLVRIVLIPFSLLYSVVLWCRHALYDFNLKKSRAFDKPVISVGNLSLGGTGKTPFTLLIAQILSESKKVAVLSRGYRRKTSGFILAHPDDSPEKIGDEPLLMAQKLKNVLVAVDANRTRGLERLFDQHHADIAILDDGMQHRKVKPQLSILLTDYQNRYTRDWLLPAGRLRDIPSRAGSAQFIVVSKCPDDVDFNAIIQEINPKPHQKVFFTKLTYSYLQPILGNQQFGTEFLHDKGIVLFTGIARPEYLIRFLKQKSDRVQSVLFKDHHDYCAEDLLRVTEIFDNFDASSKLVVTTAKDAVKLKDPVLAPLLVKLPVFVLEVEVEFLKDRDLFERELKKYA